MKKNVGGYDRLVRFVGGPLLVLVAVGSVAGYLTLPMGLAGALLVWSAFVVGLVFVVTATVQKCPINSVLGIDTYRERGTDSTEDTAALESENDPDATEFDIELDVGETDLEPPTGRPS